MKGVPGDVKLPQDNAHLLVNENSTGSQHYSYPSSFNNAPNIFPSFPPGPGPGQVPGVSAPPPPAAAFPPNFQYPTVANPTPPPNFYPNPRQPSSYFPPS
jgi:hypothetical protein